MHTPSDIRLLVARACDAAKQCAEVIVIAFDVFHIRRRDNWRWLHGRLLSISLHRRNAVTRDEDEHGLDILPW